jgi:hypothetical protein
MSSRTKRTTPQQVQHTRVEYEFRLKKIALLAPMITGIATTACKWAGLAMIFYCTYLSVAELSGKKTTADVLFKGVLDMKANEYAAYIFGGGGVIYGLRERRLRRKTTERLSKRTASLEKRIDPNRTSSGLPSTGDTRREDI